jgi:hypothetical protein
MDLCVFIVMSHHLILPSHSSWRLLMNSVFSFSALVVRRSFFSFLHIQTRSHEELEQISFDSSRLRQTSWLSKSSTFRGGFFECFTHVHEAFTNRFLFSLRFDVYHSSCHSFSSPHRRQSRRVDYRTSASSVPTFRSTSGRV